MMNTNINFVDTTFNVSEFTDTNKNNQHSIDVSEIPLQEIGNDIQCNYHRIESVVFAESLKNNFDGKYSHKEDSRDGPGSKEYEVVVIDNVMIQKRKDKKYRKYHIEIEDSSNLSCPQPNCNRLFSKMKLLKAHIRKVHCADKKAHICEECGRMFACHYLLKRHTAVHSGRTVQCIVCHMVLSERTSITAHMRTHSGIKPHACTVCNKRFSRKSTLDTHVKFVHRMGQLECTKCNERFDTRSQWTRHTSTYHRPNEQDGAAT